VLLFLFISNAVGNIVFVSTALFAGKCVCACLLFRIELFLPYAENRKASRKSDKILFLDNVLVTVAKKVPFHDIAAKSQSV